MYKLYNYTSIIKKDSKIYNFGLGYIEGGVSVKFLMVVAPIFLFVMSIGVLISMIFKIPFISLSTNGIKLTYLLVWVALASTTAGILWGVKFSGFRLYAYMLAYFKPKKVLTVGQGTVKVRELENIVIDSVIKQYF